jgi:outer membrane lipoprotein carrier protein
MTRRSLLCSLLAALALISAGPGLSRAEPAKPAPATDVVSIVDRVQAFYDKTNVFKADFRQLYTVKAYNKTKESQGQVIFKKPGKMSWRYTNNGNRVVSDGKLVKIYEAENKQMYEQQMENSQYPAALSFLVGGAKLKQSFKLRKLDAKKFKFAGGYVLEGAPKEPTPAYQRILLFVDAQTSQVRRVILLDAQGNRNQFTFDNPVVNVKVEDAEFVFAPPPGTTVVKP